MTITLNSPADILAQLATNQNVVVDPEINKTDDWPAYLGALADDDNVKDNAVAFYDTVGTVEGRIQNTGETIEHPGIQVRVRAVKYNQGWAKIWQLAQLFDKTKAGTTINVGEGTYVIQSINRGGPKSMGQEDKQKRRYHFTLNAITTIDTPAIPQPADPSLGSGFVQGS